MNEGFRSISLAARRAPSVGFVRLVAGVIQKMLRLFDHESKGGQSMTRRYYAHESSLWGVEGS